MIKNYFLVAWRTLLRNKSFSLINIAGLAVGMAVFLLIFQFVVYEWSANRFHQNFNELYRVNVVTKDGNAQEFIPAGFVPVIREKFSGIAQAVRVAEGIGGGIVSVNNEQNGSNTPFRQEQISYVDGNFLQAFSFDVVNGNASLDAPNTMALSEDMAVKLFGSTAVTGKTVTVSNQFGNHVFSIQAVLKNPKQQSDIHSDVLLSLSTLENPANRNGNDWANPSDVQSSFCNVYLQLKKGISANTLATEIIRFVRSINPDSKDDTVVLQPLSEMHLAPSLNYPLQTYGSLRMVLVFTIISILILFIAWINYINLSTAQALKRAREVGVRKVLGASRSKLVWQYLTETFILTTIAVAAALAIVQLLQPVFNSFTAKNLSLQVLSKPSFILGAAAIIVFGALLSGGYVSFVLSSFKPAKTLRGKIENISNGLSLRKSLVVFQFTISIVLIISTVVLYRQLQYMKTENLGMNINQLLVIKGPAVLGSEQRQTNLSFKNSLASLPFVTKFTSTNNVPGQGYNFSGNGFTGPNAKQGDDQKTFSVLFADNNFFNTYDITFKEGNAYSSNDVLAGWENTNRLVINTKAAQALGFDTRQPIAGKKLQWGGKLYEITGVVNDYHHLSLRDAIQPSIYLPAICSGYYTVKTDIVNMPAKLAAIKSLFQKSFPGNPFEYFFADEDYDKQYTQEQNLGSIFIAAAMFAIFIACLGLFGLSSFTAQQRVKEIGIRKVLGASIADITSLLSKDFIRLVIIAIVIASPIAWWAMQKWLQDFAYRTSISWWMFAIAGAAAVFIALATVGVQAVKAAVANPAESLKSE